MTMQTSSSPGHEARAAQGRAAIATARRGGTDGRTGLIAPGRCSATPRAQDGRPSAGRADAALGAWHAIGRQALFQPAVRQRPEGIGFIEGSTPGALAAGIRSGDA